SYKDVLSFKTESIEAIFKKAGLPEIKVMPTVASPTPTHYRNKAQYPVAKDKNGEYLIGFYAPKTHRVTPAIDCPLAKRGFSDILYTLKAIFEKTKISVYDEESGSGLLRHIYLRANDDFSQVLLTLVINGNELTGEEFFKKELQQRHPEIKGFIINVNKENSNVILGDSWKLVYGNDYIVDTLSGVKLEISAPSFYQVNHASCEVVYKMARELADLRKSDTLLDLYCGLGSIGLSMAEDCHELIGIEIIPDAVMRAKRNAKLNGIENAHFYASDAKHADKILDAAERERGKKITPDVVILDPPRAGSDKNLNEFIASLNPRKIIYISCNPATLARDVLQFKELGYTADTAFPVDMFPMTGHVETVVCLKRQFQQLSLPLRASEVATQRSSLRE
ncbi:MAG: 23S rRNA (uracil(1939)-C(5))-methyltransferase RlmD, partial [Clostridia bacterium]|nr:23S rRNA (uracil(1939)-C(5))-methyltransferase RlmD [Clostridia bacterium]